MPQVINFVSIDEFLRTDVSGHLDLRLALENLKRTLQAWLKDTDRNILADIRGVKLKVTSQDVRTYVDALTETGMGTRNRIAVVYRYEDDFDFLRLLEFLAGRKGIRLRVYEDFEEAVEWLATRRPPDAELSTGAA